MKDEGRRRNSEKTPRGGEVQEIKVEYSTLLNNK